MPYRWYSNANSVETGAWGLTVWGKSWVVADDRLSALFA